MKDEGKATQAESSRLDPAPVVFPRRARRRRVLRFVAVALVAWPVVAWVAARALVVRDEPSPRRADVIVVLSGSAAYVERARHAARLYAEGRAPKVALTDDKRRGGWNSAQQRNPFYVERAAWELRLAGVPAENIEALPERAWSTHEEAALIRRHAEARGWRAVIVVTSAYHTRRVRRALRRAFEGSGISVGLDAPPDGEQTPSPAAWWLRPGGWQLVAQEYPKIIYYLWRYD